MAIEILEIEGRARYPAVGGEMVGRELTVVLLKRDHSGGTPGSKEEPLSPIVPKADR